MDKKQPPNFYNLVNIKNFPPIDFEPFLDDYDKEYVKKLYHFLNQHIKENPINIFLGEIKFGEKCCFSNVDSLIVIDSIVTKTSKQQEPVQEMSLKVRKARIGIETLFDQIRENNLMLCKEHIYQDIPEHHQCDIIPMQEENLVLDKEAKYKRKPLQNLMAKEKQRVSPSKFFNKLSY